MKRLPEKHTEGISENTHLVKVPDEIRIPAKRALDRMLEII
jgi:quinolinate synthase